MNSSQANQSGDFQGLTIELDENTYQQSKEIHIRGFFSVFVNCGSQYAIWGQFPKSIRYKVKDLDSNTEYQTIDRELSISWSGNYTYEKYSKYPCDKIITEKFSENLQDIYFIGAPDNSIKNYAIQAEYMNFASDWVKIDNKPIKLKTF